MDSQSQIDWEKECSNYFINKTELELVESYNNTLGIRAWGISRSIYIKAMKTEMINRGWDISSILSEHVEIHLSEQYRCILVNKKLTLVNQT
jgi:hypothetical protein